MAIKHKNIINLAIILSALLAPVFCLAETDPLWLHESEKSLNSHATNQSYYFKILNTYGPSKEILRSNHLYALEKYVKDVYEAVPSSVKIDSVSGGKQPVFFVNFRSPQSDKSEFIVAKLVDSYAKFEDYQLNEYQYEYYQLFAISKVNQYPQYDDFTLTTSYNAKATAMSIIPGLGQLYKGQRAKGYVILGGEIALVTASLLLENERAYCDREYKNARPEYAGSWRSKMIGWRNFRNGAIGAAAALYIYNLIDAATSEGGRKLNVIKPGSGNFSLTPWVVPDFAGLSMSITF